MDGNANTWSDIHLLWAKHRKSSKQKDCRHAHSKCLRSPINYMLGENLSKSNVNRKIRVMVSKGSVFSNIIETLHARSDCTIWLGLTQLAFLGVAYEQCHAFIMTDGKQRQILTPSYIQTGLAIPSGFDVLWTKFY